jgi:predicted regulator of Ras-like GTPase activity (Roadblock/LC7/MglB family)
MAAARSSVHTTLQEELAALQAAGRFRMLALADPSGLAWATAGEVAAPDHLASVPAMLVRAFADRQPLLRYFSQSVMRFEYHSDGLKFVQERLDGYAPGASYLLDLPSDKDHSETVLTWSNDEYMIIRAMAVDDRSWWLIGLCSEVSAARAALKNATAGMVSRIKAAGQSGYVPLTGAGDASLRDKMLMALTAFRDATQGIRMSAVTSKDGFVVASLGDSATDPEMVAPLMGHSFLAIQESTQRLCGVTETVMLRMEEGILLGRELSDGLLFAALLEPAACTGQVLSSFGATGAALQQALQSMSVGRQSARDVEVTV